MQKNIEVEIRGRISKDKRDELVNFLKKNGKFIRTQERILLDYSTFLPGEGLENREKDIRLRVTNKTPEIIVKLGKWGVENESRKELSVLSSIGDFDKLVDIFGHLGYKKAILAIRNSVLYKYKNIPTETIKPKSNPRLFCFNILIIFIRCNLNNYQN